MSTKGRSLNSRPYIQQLFGVSIEIPSSISNWTNPKLSSLAFPTHTIWSSNSLHHIGWWPLYSSHHLRQKCQCHLWLCCHALFSVGSIMPADSTFKMYPRISPFLPPHLPLFWPKLPSPLVWIVAGDSKLLFLLLPQSNWRDPIKCVLDRIMLFRTFYSFLNSFTGKS